MYIVAQIGEMCDRYLSSHSDLCDAITEVEMRRAIAPPTKHPYRFYVNYRGVIVYDTNEVVGGYAYDNQYVN